MSRLNDDLAEPGSGFPLDPSSDADSRPRPGPTGESRSVETRPSCEGRRASGERNGVLEAFVLVLVALVLALTLKTYVAEAYEIKGRSMEPTFHHGERVVVLKAFYGIHRRDVIVFASSEDPTKDLVKRVVGLPGETLKVVGGSVYVNGVHLDETYIRNFQAGYRDTVYVSRVPEGHYYVLGDNRPDSHDSRYFQSIPAASVRGKVVVRWWPLSALESF